MLQRPVEVPSVDTVYWTLWSELQFYLLFSLVLWRGLTRQRVVAFCLVWTLVSLAGAVIPMSPQLKLVLGVDTAPFFIAGIALFLIHRFGPAPLLWAILGGSWALGLWRLAPAAADFIRYGGHVISWFGVILGVMAIFAVMASVAMGWLSWVRGRWLTVAGALTYPLYLLHQEIGYALIERLHGRVAKWPLVLALVVVMLVAAWLVHRLVERPVAPPLRRGLTGLMAKLQLRTGASSAPRDREPSIPKVGGTTGPRHRRL
jgi:peptidoglycan/LPS O-acetylase OafA/YrhL